MLFRGEFIRSDGLVCPNNVMNHGIQTFLNAALKDDALALYMALANCNPSPDLEAAGLNEPTIATNGYARIAIERSATGWPVQASLNGENYWESRFFTWEATGIGFDKAVNRLAILSHATQTTGAIVVALGSAFAAAITILSTTPEVNRRWKYRLYAR